MEDYEAVDYSEDPLEGVSIWRTPYSTSEGMYSLGLSKNLASYTSGELSRPYPVILPDIPPTWLALSTPPHSPATLGFVVGCINPNPSSAPPLSDSVPRPFSAAPSPITPFASSTTTGPPLGSFTTVPPLFGPHIFPSGRDIPAPSNPNPPPTFDTVPPQNRARNLPPTSGPKKKYRCFKSKADDIFLRLEEDIQWGETMDFADRVLVGCIRGRNYSAACLKTWATEVWGQHLVDIPFVQTFVRGWFALRFACVDHTNWVLSSYWHFEHAPVLLKRWTPLFDPETEHIGIGPVWIRLPGLPLQYWSEDIFRRIGNAIGSFMDYDKSYQHTGMMAYARLLINLDTRGGLQEYITIEWRDTARKQIIDYEGIPYRCQRCHKVGHLYKDCPLLRKSKDYVQEGDTRRPLHLSPQQPTEEIQGEQNMDEGVPQDPPGISVENPIHSSPTPPQEGAEHDGDATTGMLISYSSYIHPVLCKFEGTAPHHSIFMPSHSNNFPSVASHISPEPLPPSSLICSLPIPSPALSLSMPSLFTSSLTSLPAPSPLHPPDTPSDPDRKTEVLML